MKKLLFIFALILISCESDLKYNYYDSGELLSQGKMVDNLREGEWIVYYKSRKKYAVANYNKGLVDGKTIKYYEDGTIQSEGDYKNDKLEGSLKHFYPNGSLYSSMNYKNGLKEGEYQFYYENGEIFETGKYLQDKPIGLIKTYNRDGTILREKNYEGNEKPIKLTLTEMMEKISKLADSLEK